MESISVKKNYETCFSQCCLANILPDSPSVPMSVVAVVFPITTLHKRLLGGKQHDSLKVSSNDKNGEIISVLT